MSTISTLSSSASKLTPSRPVEGDTPTKAPTKGSPTPAAIVKLSPEAQALIEKGVTTFPEVITRTVQQANDEFAAGREELKAEAEKLRDAGVAPNEVAERSKEVRDKLKRTFRTRRARI